MRCKQPYIIIEMHFVDGHRQMEIVLNVSHPSPEAILK